MPIRYNKLWKLLIDRGMSKSELRDKAGIGTTTLSKLSNNKEVSLTVLEKICAVLDCDIGDICEYVPGEKI